MGIDAEIMIRLRGDKPTDKQLADWSWRLCEAVGADKFCIKDGLPHAEYAVKSKAWEAAFDAHPLYGEWAKEKDRRHELRSKIIADIGACPAECQRAIDFSHGYSDDEEETPCEVGKVWYQDGPSIDAEDGEWFLNVSLWTRYYGIGYERGDLLTICAIAEWIEANIPDCAVWYGGDSSGVLMEPFDANARAKLRRHLWSESGRAYFGGFGRAMGSGLRPKPCGLCVPDEPRFNEYGFGKDYTAVRCAGCGKSFETRDGGATWITKEEDK